MAMHVPLRIQAVNHDKRITHRRMEPTSRSWRQFAGKILPANICQARIRYPRELFVY
jgi:hypothetical protein